MELNADFIISPLRACIVLAKGYPKEFVAFIMYLIVYFVTLYLLVSIVLIEMPNAVTM